MTEKVAKSKYRSLDDFAVRPRFRVSPHALYPPQRRLSTPFFFRSQEDFRLVIFNAKIFNPPGTIYHTEAERIEAWASDHISKAASCVIEYETEWNIDVDRDEDVNVDADEDAAGGAAGGPGRTGSVGPDTPARRSPSVLSASVPPINRRGRNAAAKKEGISETLDPDGHFPGFKDGVGVFPPGSDWAEVMLALKLKGTVTSFSSDRVYPFHNPNHCPFLRCKGKRYRSKKERLRMEKGGPPYAADGSLDYAESRFLGMPPRFILRVWVADTVVHVTHSGRPVQCTFCPCPRLALCCPSRHSPLFATTITTRFFPANNPPLAHQRFRTYRNPNSTSNNRGRACVAVNANGEQQ